MFEILFSLKIVKTSDDIGVIDVTMGLESSSRFL